MTAVNRKIILQQQLHAHGNDIISVATMKCASGYHTHMTSLGVISINICSMDYISTRIFSRSVLQTSLCYLLQMYGLRERFQAVSIEI